MPEYDFPVWGTQGGGLAREDAGYYTFIEKPDCPDLDVGDRVPEAWGLVPANNLARAQMYRSERSPKRGKPATIQPISGDQKIINQIMQNGVGRTSSSIGDCLSGDTLAKLKALKRRL